jgi:type II secretory pathway component GspD/PulD (secretin)
MSPLFRHILKRKARYFSFICVAVIAIWPVFEAPCEEEQANKKITFKTEESSKLPSDDDIFNQRISLDLRDIDIVEALKFLASKVGLNIITNKSVTGRVSLTVENASIKDIFDIMLRSNNLAYVKETDIYNVMTEAEYKARFGRNFSDTRIVKIIRLKYAIPEQAFSLLDALKSEIGRILVDPESGNALMMDTPENIIRMEEALQEYEKKNIVKVFTLQYAKAKDVEDVLKNQLDAKKAGSIKTDERNNQVIVQALSERMKEIEGLIRDLDKQTKEVLIDIKIVKIKLQNRIDDGVEWEGLFRLFADSGITYLGSYPYSSVQSATDTWRSRDATRQALKDSIGSYPFSGTSTDYSASTKVAPGNNMHLGVINNRMDFDVLFKLLQTLGDTRILSNPKIVALNNQEAKIHVGERQAYVTTTTTTGQTTSTIAEEVTFVDVGTQISVTPTINEDGFITLKIKPEISSVTSTLVTPTNNKIPIIDTSMVETSVMVKDGTPIIITGLRREEKVKSYEQVPILGKIPLLSYAFRDGYNKLERTELLILLTPHIISGVQLTAGDDREFSGEPSQDYRTYKSLSAEKKLASTAAVPGKIEPKPYREFKEEEYSAEIKEQRYEP